MAIARSFRPPQGSFFLFGPRGIRQIVYTETEAYQMAPDDLGPYAEMDERLDEFPNFL